MHEYRQKQESEREDSRRVENTPLHVAGTSPGTGRVTSPSAANLRGRKLPAGAMIYAKNAWHE